MKKLLLATALFTITGAAFAEGISMPGSTWASMTVNPSVVRNTPEDNNVLLSGRVEQGMIVGRFGDVRINTFGAVNYSADRNGLSYNNKVAPSIGIKLQRDLGTNGILEAGIQLVHQRNFRGVDVGASSGTGVQAFVSVWSGWDLKR